MKKYLIVLCAGLLIGIGIVYLGYFRLYKTIDYIRVEYSPSYMSNDSTINFRASYEDYPDDTTAYKSEYDKAKNAYGYISRHFKRLKPLSNADNEIRIYQEQATFLFKIMDTNIIILKVKHVQDWDSKSLIKTLYKSIENSDNDLWESYLEQNKIDVKTIDVWHTYNGIPFN